MKLRPTLLALCLALATPMTLANSSSAPTPASQQGTLLAIEAEGHVQRAPDIARIGTGVSTQAADTQSAMRQNAEEMRKVLDALKRAGIAERDIQTSGISLSPQYHYSEKQPPRLSGFQANNRVQVKVRELEKLGSIMDILVRAGANELHGPAFELDKPEAARDEARTLALAEARRRADHYAKALGLKVRRIVSIDEGQQLAGMPAPMMMNARAAKAEAFDASTPIAVGENDIRIRLAVVFELGQ
ncbi:MAG: SIMPL domain-containing protein [Pseudomonadota bacterium]|nr:SIMPL domain-containing protein [Pseudomonadota bacterium]